MKNNPITEYLNFILSTDVSSRLGYELLHSRGTWFHQVDVQRSFDLRLAYNYKNRQCFYNAQDLALFMDGFTYYEGLAVAPNLGIPVDHGWVVEKRTGLVIDPTWIQEGIENPSSALYLGLPYTREQIRSNWLDTRQAEPLLIGWDSIER